MLTLAYLAIPMLILAHLVNTISVTAQAVPLAQSIPTTNFCLCNRINLANLRFSFANIILPAVTMLTFACLYVTILTLACLAVTMLTLACLAVNILTLAYLYVTILTLACLAVTILTLACVAVTMLTLACLAVIMLTLAFLAIRLSKFCSCVVFYVLCQIH